jgi:hypothetical protein
MLKRFVELIVSNAEHALALRGNNLKVGTWYQHCRIAGPIETLHQGHQIICQSFLAGRIELGKGLLEAPQCSPPDVEKLLWREIAPDDSEQGQQAR